MVRVDRSLCCTCGGCVSVCPVEALELAETYLIVDAACTECGLCLTACPVQYNAIVRLSPPGEVPKDSSAVKAEISKPQVKS